MFDTIEMQRLSAAAFALLLTVLSVGAAVGPARAIETAPVYAASAAAPVQANG